MASRHILWIASLIVVTCVSVYFLLPAYTQYRDAKLEAEELRRSLAETEAQSQQVDRDIKALQTDPRAVERVAREKLGWCRENEKIYHFDSAPTTTPEPVTEP